VGVEGDARTGVQVADGAQGAVQVRARFGVDDDELAAGLHVLVHQLLGLEDHQMGLEHDRGVLAGGGDDIGAEGQVRHEPPVHHVPLDAVDAGFLEGRYLVTQAGEIGRKDRRDDLEAVLTLAHFGPFRTRCTRDTCPGATLRNHCPRMHPAGGECSGG
jgi:hypothetical protein